MGLGLIGLSDKLKLSLVSISREGFYCMIVFGSIIISIGIIRSIIASRKNFGRTTVYNPKTDDTNYLQ